MRKFLSRKLIVAVGGAISAFLVNTGLPPEVASEITGAIVNIAGFYLLGQSVVDTTAVIRGKKEAP